MEKDLRREGYSKEDEYFHKLNKALIEKLKKEGEGKEEESKEEENA